MVLSSWLCYLTHSFFPRFFLGLFRWARFFSSVISFACANSPWHHPARLTHKTWRPEHWSCLALAFILASASAIRNHASPPMVFALPASRPLRCRRPLRAPAAKPRFNDGRCPDNPSRVLTRTRHAPLTAPSQDHRAQTPRVAGTPPSFLCTSAKGGQEPRAKRHSAWLGLGRIPRRPTLPSK